MLSRPPREETSQFEILKIRNASMRLEAAFDVLSGLIRSNVEKGHIQPESYPASETYCFVADTIADEALKQTAKAAIRKERPPTYADAAAIVTRIQAGR